MSAATTPSPSQQQAIEAEPQALLVLAGPGAGKTYCLTERIRFLIACHGFDPARICAFTFTNKAAGEIAHRLTTGLGEAAERITRGTLHAFCAALLREAPLSIGLEPGFGIADDEYQLGVLRRIEGPKEWHKNTLKQFSAFRFRNTPLRHNDLVLFDKYERFLSSRQLVDFDTLVIKAAELLEETAAAAAIRARWDVILVDEFQDLNPVQYRVIRALARDHGHVFAVGDDEQSIYSWAGADPSVFTRFAGDFGAARTVHLAENRRCPQNVFALARTLVTINTPIFHDRITPRAHRVSPFPVGALAFATDDEEIAWLIADVRRDRDEHRHPWGDVAVLYRRHAIGDRLETAFVNAGIPCRLAQGHALSEDPAVAYLMAAARVIMAPDDELFRHAYFQALLPRAMFDEARTQAEERHVQLHQQLQHMAAHHSRASESARQIRRALTDWSNLQAVRRQHTTLSALIQDLLSRNVGVVHSVLDRQQDEISDPASLPDVVRVADRLRDARLRGVPVLLPALGGMEIAVAGLLAGIGVRTVREIENAPQSTKRAASNAVATIDDVPSVGLALGVFKAAQLIAMTEEAAAPFTSFTAIDLETTDRNRQTAGVVEIAAVRVREGRIVETFSSLVNPEMPISPAATDKHGISDADVARAPTFGEIWPKCRAFCGDDVIIAHNGNDFDFPILKRLARQTKTPFDCCLFDTLPLARDLVQTSCKLEDLARHFGVGLEHAHRALDDTSALAQIMLALGELQQARARKTALVNLLDHLGVALALADQDTLGNEARLFRQIARPFALSRYSDCLDSYERLRGDDQTAPSVDEVIDRLGGVKLMLKIRAVKSADDRYPVTMRRLRRLIAGIPAKPLIEQLSLFLERLVLSRKEGDETEADCINLLTLHSTKGLEFSRVYVVGVEDAQLPGGSPTKPLDAQEVEEARRLLYVGMTRTKDRLVLTRADTREGKDSGGQQFLEEMRLTPQRPE